MWQRWIQQWWALLSSPQKYYQVSHWPWRVVWSYAITAAVLLGVTSAVYFNSVELRQLKNTWTQTQQEILSYFPQNLVVMWDGARLTTNHDQPEVVYYPSFVTAQPWQLPERLAYYVPQDITNAADTANQLPTSSLSILTPTTLFVSDVNGSWNSLPLAQLFEGIPALTITSATLAGQLQTIQPHIDSLVRLVGISSFLLFPISILGTRVITSLFDGILVWFFLKLQHFQFTYGQIIKMSLLISMIASATQLIAELIYGSVSLPIFGIVYWGYWLLIVLVGRWHVSQLRRQQ